MLFGTKEQFEPLFVCIMLEGTKDQ